jgi:hypothetical protein
VRRIEFMCSGENMHRWIGATQSTLRWCVAGSSCVKAVDGNPGGRQASVTSCQRAYVAGPVICRNHRVGAG